MKVFLTGGTGYIGQPLTKQLLARGWEVVALVRKPDSPQAKFLSEMGATCVAGDVTDRESMREPMAGADIVLHNAGWYELGVPKSARHQMYAINVTGTDNVLGLAHEHGIPRTVHVSSTNYYGDTGNEVRDETFRRQSGYHHYYEQTKTEAHELALQYMQRELPVTIVCPAGVVGPNDHSVWGYFLRTYLNNLMPPFAWAPDTMNSNVYLDDLAEGIALAAEKGRIGETYLLTGEPVRLRDVIAIWNSQPGGQKTRFFIPTGLASAMFSTMEPLQRLVGLPAFISRESVAAGAFAYAFSSAKAQRELDWSHLSAEEMWLRTIEQERELMAKRQKRDIVSRLKPVEDA